MNARISRLIARSGLPKATQRDLKRKWPTLRPADRAAASLDLARLASAKPPLNSQQQMPPPPVQVGPVEGVG